MRSLVLKWHKAVKFDQANAFATKYSKLPKGITKVRMIGEGLPKPSETSVGSDGEGKAAVSAASAVSQASSGNASSILDHSDHVSCALVVASSLGWPRLAPIFGQMTFW